MRDTGDFIVACDRISDSIWSVKHRWVDSNESTEVVWCKHCKFYTPNTDDTLGGCTLLDFYTKGMENGFCAWGERKES